MKQLLFTSFVFLSTACSCFAQVQSSPSMPKAKFGLTGGLNFFSINRIKSVDLTTNNNTGFFVGGHYSVPAKTFGYRTEVLFSRQGYDYKTGSQTGGVMLDYLVLPQLTTLNMTKFFQLYAGAQVAFLLNTKVDSLPGPSSVPNMEDAKDYFSKINYGFTAGVEAKPLAGLLVGGRYNLFFNLLQNSNTASPSYIPKYEGNLKNGLLQLYVGYRF
jgi:hypothetical protein